MKTKPAKNMRGIILCCVLLLTIPLFARESTDVLIMKNGDHLTGEIKGLNAGVLYMSMPYILGTSSVQWSNVARLESNQLFLVKTEDGSVYTGTLNTADTPSGRPMEIAVVDTSAREVLVSTQIVEMDTTSSKFWRRFNGGINTGVTYSKGNQSTQYNLGSEVSYPQPRWGARASFDSNLTSSTGATASTRNQLDAQAFHLMRWDNWFYEGLGSFLQSSEQGIVNQATFGGGVGRYLKNSNSSRVSLVGGFVGQNTTYQSNIVGQKLASGLVAANMQFFRFNKTNGSLEAALMPALSEPGRIKFNLNATYYIKITGDLSWNASFYGNWDNRPPNGLPGSDYGSTSGLSWTFGNNK